MERRGTSGTVGTPRESHSPVLLTPAGHPSPAPRSRASVLFTVGRHTWRQLARRIEGDHTQKAVGEQSRSRPPGWPRKSGQRQGSGHTKGVPGYWLAVQGVVIEAQGCQLEPRGPGVPVRKPKVCEGYGMRVVVSANGCSSKGPAAGSLANLEAHSSLGSRVTRRTLQRRAPPGASSSGWTPAGCGA